ncbi:uncharacterized protein RAG0_12859 [Rhynchosporium agropyri]|uniref:N-acetyltransferase domain-containing protein n=1 Tax=Rhynchosporium agropyri TaxID=914238 RepID=A0A1E1LAI6_9HELO|nr:uncharacterized protein RAG0_12859 [Rhynchosporium agropyri]
MDEMESDFRPKGNCFVLEQLATASSHQRRGIGAQLVKYGLEKADRQGMVCYLSGAPMGVLVCRKLWGLRKRGDRRFRLKSLVVMEHMSTASLVARSVPSC